MRDSVIIDKVVDYVLKLEDDYDCGLVKGKIEFFMGDEKLKAIKKKSGLYVFVNLASNSSFIYIKMDYYHNLEVEIDSSSARNKIHLYRIKPNSSYPYFKNNVSINFTLDIKDSKEADLSESLIIAYLFGEVDYAARVVEKTTEGCVIKSAGNKINIGDEFTSEGSKGAIRILEEEEDNTYKLSFIKNITLSEGDKLYKAVVTKASTTGNCVIYFNNMYKAYADARILVFYRGAFKEVTIKIKENNSYNLGVVHI